MTAKNLIKRTFSALAVLLVLAIAAYFFKERGVMVVGLIVCAGGIFEFTHLVIRPLNLPRPVLITYFLLAVVILILSAIFSPSTALSALVLSAPVLIAGVLWLKRASEDLFSIQSFAGLAILGFIYAAVTPGVTIHLLLEPNGVKWFSLLLIIVFVGDISAYFGGSMVGGPKLMPAVSPNKTVAGSISGLIGSSVVGVVCFYEFHFSISLIVAFFICAVANLLAQSGDLFESLLKRVSNVKDSGHFLPGHGGVLDRLDGVYFAAPVILCAAHWFS